MSDHATTFIVLTILVLATILLIFGMKYFSASRQTRLRAASEDSYRSLADKATAAQAATSAALAAMADDLSEIRGKLASVEKVLREVA